MRILIVEDERDVAEFLRILLGRLGHESAVARTGREALQHLESGPFDLIISDIRMPEMDGRQLYEHLEKGNSPMTRRILFVTGDEVNPPTQEFFERTGCPYLVKPYNVQQIQQAISRF